MNRLKLILPAGRPENGAMIAHAKLVDADTGEPIEPVRGVRLELPFDGDGPGVAIVSAELLVAEIETVPREREAETFPGWVQRAAVGVRGRAQKPEG